MEEQRFDICIPTKDKSKLDLKRMNIDIIPYNNILISDAKGLSNARNELMSQVTTEWFLFLDDDIQINQKWWDKIKRYVKDEDMLERGCEPRRIGAVNGFGFSKSLFLKLLRYFLLITRGYDNQRGFTSNTLLRKKAVNGIVLTRQGRLEDVELQDKIKSKGYEWLFCHAYCTHLKESRTVWEEAVNDFKTIIKEEGLIQAIRKI